MNDKSAVAKIVRVNIETGSSGLLFATSPDLKGLFVAERTKEELEIQIPLAIKALYLASDEHALIMKAEDLEGDDGVESWVKIPGTFERQGECA